MEVCGILRRGRGLKRRVENLIECGNVPGRGLT